MKRFIHIITLLAAVAVVLPAFAVTDKEMEEARTIATKTYLRYANNGSGYLDDLHPKTMAELEKNLKEKEKANLKAFKAIPVPSDYASWDKDKLVDYWSTTAFASKGLSDQGKVGKSRARKLLGAMTVSAPSAAPSAQTKPAVPETPAPAATADQQTSPEAQTSANPDHNIADTAAVPSPSLELAEIEQQVMAEAALEDDAPIRKANNHTWFYIIALVVLVGIVIWLVVFASKVFKKSTAGDDSAPIYPSDDARLRKALEKTERENSDLRAQIASRDAKLKSLTRRVEEAEQSNARLKEQLDRLSSQAQQQRFAPSQSAKPSDQSMQTPVPPRPAPATAQSAGRTIYLGRANAKGIFVRADRTLNPGQSVFRLDTTDGFAGSFRVASDPRVWESALINPTESLAGACVAPDLTATEGKERIVNDSSGTAIFEGGCWKVIRKAKIHFE